MFARRIMIWKVLVVSVFLFLFSALPGSRMTAQSSEIHTLILTNKSALIAQYGETETNALLTQLDAVATHTAVNGKIIFVEENPIVADAYAAWHSNLTSPSHANAVAEAIMREIVFAEERAHPFTKYIVLVGDDRIIPHRRVPDNTPQFSERTYSNVSSDTTVGSALAANMFLSDDYYGVRESFAAAATATTQMPQVIDASVAVGRLVETPAEMGAVLTKFLETNGQIQLTNSLVAAYDFLADSGQKICNTITPVAPLTPNCTFIGDEWQGKTLQEQLATGNAPLLFLMTHANHESIGAPDATKIHVADVSNWSVPPTGRLVFSLGGHAGLNVPPENITATDWPQLWLSQGALYVGNTGYDWGLINDIGLSEELAIRFAEALAHEHAVSIGSALLAAKDGYLRDKTELTSYDEKVINELTLYGLPMTQLVGFAGSPDSYEPDDICSTASEISADGTPQSHSLHGSSDVDWLWFDGIADKTYEIRGISTLWSTGLQLELFFPCEPSEWVVQSSQKWGGPRGVSVEFTVPQTGRYYLRTSSFMANESYDISLTMKDDPLVPTPTPTPTVPVETQRGAVIIAAGRNQASDRQQNNIHHVAGQVYRLFTDQGYAAEDIYLLANDKTLPGYDAAATEDNLQAAITQWATSRVAAGQSLTLYLIDHGSQDRFYLDKVNDQIVTPQELDEWLSVFEETVPGAKVNVILEACFIGSFIVEPQSISSVNRIVIASSSGDWSAYASPKGAFFSDYFLTAIRQGKDIATSFLDARHQVELALGHANQNPWIDANGNSVPNEEADYALAAGRRFVDELSLGAGVAPQITTATVQLNGLGPQGTLHAEVVDDGTIAQVWALIYPPSYVPPIGNEDLLVETVPQQELTRQSPGEYEIFYPDFNELGTYRIVFYAEDEFGNLSQPIVHQLRVGNLQYLPVVLR